MNGPTIGLDARKIQDSGIGRYLQGLLRAWAAREGPERFVLFLSDPAAPLPQGLEAALRPPRFMRCACRAPLYSVRELLAFRGVAGRFGLDLLHFPHYVRAFAPGCPVCVTIHDAIHLSHPPSRAAALYARAMMAWSARSAAVLFAPSEAARRDIAARLSVPESRFVVTPNGVGASFSPPGRAAVERVRADRALSAPFVLCVASHRPHKNLQAAVEGFRRAALPDAELVVPAPDEAAARRLTPFTRPGVRVLAGVTDDELAALYAASTLVLAPSLAEGFGLPPLEAAACGAPVLASAIPAHREVVGDVAELFDPATGPDGVAAALRTLWDDPARRAELAARGPEHAVRFRWEQTAERTLGAYRRALGGDSWPVPGSVC